MKLINRIMLIVSAVALAWVVENVGLLLYIGSLIEAGKIDIPEWIGYTVALFILATMLFHFVSLVHLVRLLRYFRDEDMLRALSFVIGFFSMFLLLVDVVMLNDIGHEILVGYHSAEEWNIVFANHGIHALFALLMFLQCLAARRRMEKNEAKLDAVKDEALYMTVHQTGICSSVIGLLLVVAVFSFNVSQLYINGLLFMFSVVGLFPYALAVLYWFLTKRKERPGDWYDEKQLADLSHGALVTLVVSVIVVMVFYGLISFHIMDSSVSIWFPIYFFLTLLVFSGSTLYFNKRV